MGFDSLRNHTKRYKKLLTKTRAISYGKLAAAIVMDTPVQYGDLRASWTPSIGANIKVENISVNGQDAQRHDITAVINQLEWGDTFNLANGQPYARRIEHDGWSPQKAPQGMLFVNAAQWREMVKESLHEAQGTI